MPRIHEFEATFLVCCIQLPEDDTPKGVKVMLFQCWSFLPLPVYSLNSVYWLLKPTSAAAVWVQNIMLMCISFRDHIHIDWRQGYLLPTLAWKITCRRFDWTLQSSSLSPWRRLEHSVETSAFSRNVGKLFFELKLVILFMQKPTGKPLKVSWFYRCQQLGCRFQSSPTRVLRLGSCYNQLL